jgi:[acyl-carrier-protein] S-malonyltransferase
VVEAVNFNCPGQIVVAGHKKAVQQAMKLAKQKGAKLALALAVSIPSHCSLMREAGNKLRNYLNKLDWQNPQVPLVTNVDAAVVTNAARLKSALVKQLNSPVYWEDSIRTMLGQGIDTFIEVGPGSVLTRLLKRIERGVASHSVGNAESLAKLISVTFSQKEGPT